MCQLIVLNFVVPLPRTPEQDYQPTSLAIGACEEIDYYRMSIFTILLQLLE